MEKKEWRLALLKSVLFSFVFMMSIGLLPVYASPEDKMITGLGTEVIGKPSADSSVTGWTGSYVYFGKYGDTTETMLPVKYRVLTNSATWLTETGNTEPGVVAYTLSGMLLDSDAVLFDRNYDKSGNEWSQSQLRTFLNGTGFLEKEGVFTSLEKDAILESMKAPSSY